MSKLPKPENVIPHRHPFLFLTEVLNVEKEKSGQGYWQLSQNDNFFSGHFPSFPTLPGVLMCESIAQLGAYVLLSNPAFSEKIPLFGGIDKVRFRRQVKPGERLDLYIEISKISARGGKGSGVAKVNNQIACTCDLMFIFTDSPI